MNAPGVVDILQRRTFRFLFLGVTLSRIGDAMTFVVISWLALGIGGRGLSASSCSRAAAWHLSPLG